MTENILQLYNTFLARFSFFRKHIQLLLDLFKKVDSLDHEVAKLIEMVELLNEENKELANRCEELEKALEKRPSKAETSRDLMRTSQDIMQSIYSNYYSTGEALPDIR